MPSVFSFLLEQSAIRIARPVAMAERGHQFKLTWGVVDQRKQEELVRHDLRPLAQCMD